MANRGPLPFSLEITSSDNTQAIGEIISDGKFLKDGYDKMFDMNIRKFSIYVVFSQRIQIIDISKPAIVQLGYEYMTCNDVLCLNPIYQCAQYSLKRHLVTSKK